MSFEDYTGTNTDDTTIDDITFDQKRSYQVYLQPSINGVYLTEQLATTIVIAAKPTFRDLSNIQVEEDTENYSIDLAEYVIGTVDTWSLVSSSMGFSLEGSTLTLQKVPQYGMSVNALVKVVNSGGATSTNVQIHATQKPYSGPNITINEDNRLFNGTIYIAQESTYVDAGASAIDNNADNIIVSDDSNNVNTNEPNTYTITYEANDGVYSTIETKDVVVFERVYDPITLDNQKLTIKPQWPGVPYMYRLDGITENVFVNAETNEVEVDITNISNGSIVPIILTPVNNDKVALGDPFHIDTFYKEVKLYQKTDEGTTEPNLEFLKTQNLLPSDIIVSVSNEGKVELKNPPPTNATIANFTDNILGTIIVYYGNDTLNLNGDVNVSIYMNETWIDPVETFSNDNTIFLNTEISGPNGLFVFNNAVPGVYTYSYKFGTLTASRTVTVKPRVQTIVRKVINEKTNYTILLNDLRINEVDLSWSIVSGSDFEIVGNALNFDKKDYGSTNQYSVTVQGQINGANTDPINVTLNVLQLPPNFLENNINRDVAENTDNYEIDLTNHIDTQKGDVQTWSIDNNDFVLIGSKLYLPEVPSYEDVQNRIKTVTVNASNSSGSDQVTIKITVTDIDENPEVTEYPALTLRTYLGAQTLLELKNYITDPENTIIAFTKIEGNPHISISTTGTVTYNGNQINEEIASIAVKAEDGGTNGKYINHVVSMTVDNGVTIVQDNNTFEYTREDQTIKFLPAWIEDVTHYSYRLSKLNTGPAVTVVNSATIELVEMDNVIPIDINFLDDGEMYKLYVTPTTSAGIAIGYESEFATFTVRKTLQLNINDISFDADNTSIAVVENNLTFNPRWSNANTLASYYYEVSGTTVSGTTNYEEETSIPLSYLGYGTYNVLVRPENVVGATLTLIHSFTIAKPENLARSILLNGPETVTLDYGSIYEEYATTSDDGNFSSNVVPANFLNDDGYMMTPGVFVITYTHEVEAGVTNTRTVTVRPGLTSNEISHTVVTSLEFNLNSLLKNHKTTTPVKWEFDEANNIVQIENDYILSFAQGQELSSTTAKLKAIIGTENQAYNSSDIVTINIVVEEEAPIFSFDTLTPTLIVKNGKATLSGLSSASNLNYRLIRVGSYGQGTDLHSLFSIENNMIKYVPKSSTTWDGTDNRQSRLNLHIQATKEGGTKTTTKTLRIDIEHLTEWTSSYIQNNNDITVTLTSIPSDLNKFKVKFSTYEDEVEFSPDQDTSLTFTTTTRYVTSTLYDVEIWGVDDDDNVITERKKITGLTFTGIEQALPKDIISDGDVQAVRNARYKNNDNIVLDEIFGQGSTVLDKLKSNNINEKRKARHAVCDVILLDNSVDKVTINRSELQFTTDSRKSKVAVIRPNRVVTLSQIIDADTSCYIPLNKDIHGQYVDIKIGNRPVTKIIIENQTYKIDDTQYDDGDSITISGFSLTFGGLEVNNLSGSGVGDPYIKPVYGNVYKLPVDNRCYRMFESRELLINAQMWIPSNAESKHIRHQMQCFFKNNKSAATKAHDVYHNLGMSFMRFVNIMYKDQSLRVDLETMTVMNTKTRLKIRNKYLRNMPYYAKDVAFVNDVYVHTEDLGVVHIELARYINPQVRTGINISLEKSEMFDECHGLLVRELRTKTYRVNNLSSTNLIALRKQRRKRKCKRQEEHFYYIDKNM